MYLHYAMLPHQFMLEGMLWFCKYTIEDHVSWQSTSIPPSNPRQWDFNNESSIHSTFFFYALIIVQLKNLTNPLG